MVAQMISELPPLKTISNIFQSKSRIILFMSLIIFTTLGIVFLCNGFRNHAVRLTSCFLALQTS